ncbi:gamma-glutamyltransferase [Paracoccidioides brasiliensis]|nr:gamma-glutamyltransferase [Paracoccidioides brasiliensis]
MLTGLLATVSFAAMMLLTAFYRFSSIATFRVAWNVSSGQGQAKTGSDGTPGNEDAPGRGLGAVASENGYCSGLGVGMLKEGGNAVDAMVATVFCIGVTGEPPSTSYIILGQICSLADRIIALLAMYHSNIGGGGFAVVRTPENRYEFVDFRETAPAAAFEDMYKDNEQASITGGLASGVPGEVRGLEYLHKKYGSLPWPKVMQPAIRTARDGWRVNEDLARMMESETKDEDFLSKNPSWAIDFAPNGTRLGLGDIITRRRYARTLEQIANHGPDAFYSGPIAEATIQALQASNGTMTLGDLKNYTVMIRNVSQIMYRGYRVTGASAPSGGSVGLSILNILNQYDRFFSPGTVNLSTHRMTEAYRFAYGQRTNLGDPSFVDNVTEYEEDMLRVSTAAQIRAKIFDESTQNVSVYDPAGHQILETPGTSHLVSTDRTGLAVSLTTTINLIFGSKLMVPETGIVMNNEMNDFSIPDTSNKFGYIPTPANFIRPGKRMLSSMCPIIVTHPDGSLFFVTGAAGGSRIITATVQSVINVIDRKLNASRALEEPRLHDQLVPNLTLFEWAFDNSTVEFMAERGHNVTPVAPGFSSVQCIQVSGNSTFEAVGEPRQKNSGGIVV